jgi:hypothetical protein
VLVIMALSFGGPWITIVALKAIAAEMGGLRSIPSLASSLSWVGVGAGGIVMGAVAEKVGVRWTTMFGSLMILAGLALSTFGGAWQLYLGQGLLMGVLGIGSMNAPFYVYVGRALRSFRILCPCLWCGGGGKCRQFRDHQRSRAPPEKPVRALCHCLTMRHSDRRYAPYTGSASGAPPSASTRHSFAFNCDSFAAINARISAAMSSSLSHCSLYKVIGKRPMP